MTQRGTRRKAALGILASNIANQRRRISDHVAAFSMLTGIGVSVWVYQANDGLAILSAVGMWLATLLVVVIIVAGGHTNE